MYKLLLINVFYFVHSNHLFDGSDDILGMNGFFSPKKYANFFFFFLNNIIYFLRFFVVVQIFDCNEAVYVVNFKIKIRT